MCVQSTTRRNVLHTMNGCVLSGTAIAVDFWQVQKQPGIKLFFLTHLHGDHIVGLTSSWRRPIHCSPITAQLLVERHGLDSSVLRSLTVGETHLLSYCHGNCLHNSSKKSEASTAESRQEQSRVEKQWSCDTVSVTVIDANHCPGSVMFLFESSFGKMLYTGDFRFDPDMVAKDSILSRHVGSIDRVYLDNTYCSPKCVFPSRHKALEEIVRIVQTHADHDVVFALRGLGKEELLAAVGLAVGEWINIPSQTFSILTKLGFPNIFKTGYPDTRLRVTSFHDVSSKYIQQLNEKKPTIVILPTALYQGICGCPYVNVPEVFVVPYSDHSSYPELKEFVSSLKPAQVLPIVRGKTRGPFGVDISNRQDMTCFQNYLSRPHPSQTVDFLTSPRQCSQASSQALGSCGFQSLFPDLIQDSLPPLKKKQTMRKRVRKVLCPKGVGYLSDGEEGVAAETKPAVSLQLSATSGQKAPDTHCPVLGEKVHGCMNGADDEVICLDNAADEENVQANHQDQQSSGTEKQQKRGKSVADNTEDKRVALSSSSTSEPDRRNESRLESVQLCGQAVCQVSSSHPVFIAVKRKAPTAASDVKKSKECTKHTHSSTNGAVPFTGDEKQKKTASRKLTQCRDMHNGSARPASSSSGSKPICPLSVTKGRVRAPNVSLLVHEFLADRTSHTKAEIIRQQRAKLMQTYSAFRSFQKCKEDKSD